MNLLIADDELTIRRGLLSLDWKSIGIDEVYSASNGLEVKELLLAVPVNLAIFDIKMPGMSGLELANMIHEYSLGTQVILLTGFSDFEYAREAIHLNVYEYIVKPFHPRKLLQTVAKAKRDLEKRQYQDIAVREYEKNENVTDLSNQVQRYFSRTSEIVTSILIEMAERYAEPISLEELAEKYHFSATYLSRKIKQETGYFFVDILKAIRLVRTIQLIQDGEKINQACQKAGFRDQRYFSQVFRNTFGCSPSEFRRQDQTDLRFYEVLQNMAKNRRVVMRHEKG
jgi:YesN/AraC family two-component response regulator